MGEKPLVDGLIFDSFAFILGLDALDSSPSLAVWYFYEDADDWRLIIAGPNFDKFLPKQEALAYQKVSEAISHSNLQSLSISLVKLIRTDDALSKALGFLVGTPPDGFTRASFTNTSLNGIFIKEMIVLRSALNANR
ncbi:hypothetical protein ACK3ZA_07430 [Aeromonas caviae]